MSPFSFTVSTLSTVGPGRNLKCPSLRSVSPFDLFPCWFLISLPEETMPTRYSMKVSLFCLEPWFTLSYLGLILTLLWPFWIASALWVFLGLPVPRRPIVLCL
uniref:Uncharacterized protein n=1 Tax=Opuntia streptacantha TaxID=393608 RepID=A0A7C8ZFQ9_OPUST